MADVTARQPTPESKQFALDERNRVKHIHAAKRAFKALLPRLTAIAEVAREEHPGRDKASKSRRGRFFNKHAKTHPALVEYLDQWIGTEDQHPKAYSWRNAILYAARNVLVYGMTQREALTEVEKQASKGFEAITMADAQGPLREVVPTALREYLPKNIVVEVDEKGTISRVTDRFENEHLTLGVKIEKMRSLVARYNAIAKKVKKDLRSRDEFTKLSALITAIIMETGIRPGRAGNAKAKTVNGEEVMVETFGAITLGPAHVNFVRANFATLEFIGKMGSVNTAEISDSGIIKVINAYVNRALKKGTKYIFVTREGERFSYADLQRYFRENFAGLSPTDFRKLRATEVVLGALRDEQAALYARIREFAGTAKKDLKARVVQAIVDTFEAAIAKSQAALSHDDSATTIRSYINPEVILRFLSTGRVEDSLESAILSGETALAFDPQNFVQLATGKTAMRTTTSLGDLLLDLRSDLDEAGVRKMAQATLRVADRVFLDQAEGYIQKYTRPLAMMYKALAAGINSGISQKLPGNHPAVRNGTKDAWKRLINFGMWLTKGIHTARSIPAGKAKGFEMAYRLFHNSRRQPRDMYKWFRKNQKRIDLVFEALSWPQKQEGSDDLFQVGSFQVHNTVSATGKKLERIKKIITLAEKAARTNPVPGFARAVYGDLHVVGRITKSHHAAWYHLTDDSMYLRMVRGADREIAQSVVHELGHRYWKRFAKDEAKRKWARHHEEVGGREVAFDMPGVGDDLPVRYRHQKGPSTVLREEGGIYYFKAVIKGVAREGNVPKFEVAKLLRKDATRRNYPTLYSSTSHEEHFCEALKLYAFGELPPEHKEAFDRIWR